MQKKFEFFSMKEIISYLAIFFSLGIFVGWSFSEYKILRLNNINTRIENFDSHQNKFQSQVSEIKGYMNHNLQLYFNNLKINKYFSKCLTISDNNRVVQFHMDFTRTPKVLVSVNQYTITYGGSSGVNDDEEDGTLVKKTLNWQID